MSTSTPAQKPHIPNDPDNLSITIADQELLRDWFASNDPITELAHLHNLSIMELARWAQRPEIARILHTLKQVHAERFQLKAIATAYDALITLHFIATTQHPTNAHEIARRAATKLIALAFPSRLAQSVPSPSPAPAPSSSPPPPSPAPSTTVTAPPSFPSAIQTPMPRSAIVSQLAKATRRSPCPIPPRSRPNPTPTPTTTPSPSPSPAPQAAPSTSSQCSPSSSSPSPCAPP